MSETKVANVTKVECTIATELIKTCVRNGDASDTLITSLFLCCYKHIPMTQQEKMVMFVDATSVRGVNANMDYANSWIDLDLPTDGDGNPCR